MLNQLAPSGHNVQVNTTLDRLELNSNAIDESGVTALAEALVENKTLTALALRYCSCPCK